jgi:hypothetical protein
MIRIADRGKYRPFPDERIQFGATLKAVIPHRSQERWLLAEITFFRGICLSSLPSLRHRGSGFEFEYC